LKHENNALKEENLRLKTRINALERETNKFGKMIQEVNNMNIDYGKGPNHKLNDV